MADITRFNPFRALTSFEPFGREFDELFKGFLLTPLSSKHLTGGQIPVDVTEDEKAYKVRAELPGFNKDEISVSVNADQVSISAETKKEKEEKKGEEVVFRECYYGKQYRSFTLPQGVDEAGATAKYEDGVLSLMLPKKALTETKKIAIE